MGAAIGSVLLLDFPAFRAARETLSLGEAPFRLLLLGLALVLLGSAAALRRAFGRT